MVLNMDDLSMELHVSKEEGQHLVLLLMPCRTRVACEMRAQAYRRWGVGPGGGESERECERERERESESDSDSESESEGGCARG